MTPLQSAAPSKQSVQNPTFHFRTAAAIITPHLPKNFLKPLDFFLVSGEDGRGAAARGFCRGTPAKSRCSAALRSGSAEEKKTTN